MYQPYAVNEAPRERPKILCLHGGGSSAGIFQMQLIRLSRVLEPRFEFVFLDGPIETEAGPGVLPVFEGCGPYRRWVSDDPSLPAEEFQRQKDTAMAMLKVYVQQTGPYVGVLGFSQGARAASSLLLEQQRQPFVPYQLFGVFLCGTYPPFVPDDVLIRLPTVHVVGLFDPWKPASEMLIEQCSEQSTRKVVRYPGGHHLPNAPEAIQNIANMVIDLWKETTGATA
ncbi:oxidoreductase [Colletotrichum orchidophilum]|uniref:Oxidoreductase n=1 Tax=Colletotrichum orchidophilum TaxID=1209926 RepID=A0A1G4BNC5_9PEZI|nr:oxidoreductase [Colletotrichum orchidophilum]OHF02959.1 oxidoreductase [Colletotrichum orchidophilum]